MAIRAAVETFDGESYPQYRTGAVDFQEKSSAACRRVIAMISRRAVKPHTNHDAWTNVTCHVNNVLRITAPVYVTRQRTRRTGG